MELGENPEPSGGISKDPNLFHQMAPQSLKNGGKGEATDQTFQSCLSGSLEGHERTSFGPQGSRDVSL